MRWGKGVRFRGDAEKKWFAQGTQRAQRHIVRARSKYANVFNIGALIEGRWRDQTVRLCVLCANNTSFLSALPL